jgi:formamidopyrimidine-DNA glycosylase
MVRRGLASLGGAAVVAVNGAVHPRFSAAATAAGSVWHQVSRRGKWLAVELDHGWMQLHLGMTGRLDLTAAGATPVPLGHVHAGFRFADGRLLRFSDPRRFGRITWAATAFEGIELGPEPGEPAAHATLDAAVRRRTTAVFLTLLDQMVCAGVGSYLAQEALWRARVAPHATRLSPVRVTRLSDALAAVVADAISHGGVSMRDYVHVDGSRGSMQDLLECYGRAGQPCRRCGSGLRRQVIGGRGVTWCPRCQR